MGRTTRKSSGTQKSESRGSPRRSKKRAMDDLTDVTGGIVHDFNNILSGLMGHAELALLELPESHPARFHLNLVLASGCRASELVRELFACTGEDPPHLEPKPCFHARGRGESILLVDNEVSLARMWRALLCNLGYSVTLCHDGLEALSHCQDNQNAFHLVIADGAMPHLTGWELASKLESCLPGLPVILAAGGEAPSRPPPGNVRRCLEKPIALSEMLHAIREVLELNRHSPHA